MQRKRNMLSFWNYSTVALLLDAYLAVEQGQGSRKVMLDRLEKAFQRYIQEKGIAPSSGMISRPELEMKYGKLEYAMTQGKRGLMGAPDMRIQDIVKIYRTKRYLYDIYLRYGSQDSGWQICGKPKGGESERKETAQETVGCDQPASPADLEKPVQISSPDKDQKTGNSSFSLYRWATAEVKPVFNGRVTETGKQKEVQQHRPACADDKDKLPVIEEKMNNPQASTGYALETSVSKNVLQKETGKEHYEWQKGRSDEQSGFSNGVNKYQWISLNTPIEELGFPTRIFHCLYWNKLQTVKDLLDFPADQWSSLRNMGAKGRDFLLTEIEKIKCAMKQPHPPQPLRKAEETPKEFPREEKVIHVPDWKEWFKTIGRALELPPRTIRKYLLNQEFEASQGEQAAMDLLWEWPETRAFLREKIGNFLDTTRGKGASREELLAMLPAPFRDADRLQTLLRNLAEDRRIRLYGTMVYPLYPMLEEYVQRIPNERKRKIISLRLDGLTLEETAKATGITRERVRQIQKRWLSPKLKTEEIRYLYFWEKYPALESSDVQYVLNLPDRTRRYLEFIESLPASDELETPARTEALRHVAEDGELTEDARQRARRCADELDGEFFIGGARIQKNRSSLMKYVVQTYARDKVTYREVVKHYHQLLNELGVDSNKSYSIGPGYINKLSLSDYVLWNRKESLRYYDIPARKYSALLDALHLEKLQDVEYSTLKFFRDLPDVMRTYDIRDEYELHNLLRKIWQRDDRNVGLDEHHQVTFAKMPTIRIGHVDRYTQIYRFIQEHEPIKKADLIPMYAEAYGVRIQSFQGNAPLQAFDRYCYGGEYRIHWEGLSEEVVAELKPFLMEDLYRKRDISEIYMGIVNGNPWDINAYVLHQLGFESHGDYVIRETYDSAADLFHHVLTAADIVDLRDRRYYRNYSPFGVAADALAADYRVLEVEPDIFYSGRELEKRGITAESMRAFCQNVKAFVPKEALFTVHSLRQHGFPLPWTDAGISDFFYNSVLSADKSDFASLFCGGGRLFYNGALDRQLSVSDLFVHVIDRTWEALSIGELQTLIQQQFGLRTKPEKIREFVKANVQYKGKILF